MQSTPTSFKMVLDFSLIITFPVYSMNHNIPFLSKSPLDNGDHTETIVAQATAPGKGSVGIVRISGPNAAIIAQKICKKELKPRYAHYLPFKNEQNQTIDEGIALFFKGPNSFTGEDILELQGHGGPVVIDILIKLSCRLGARLAKPGEFSERAFLNSRIDLSQAEAIADLINSNSEQAARNAVQSMQGVFSDLVQQLVSNLIALRVYVEAAIDFPEEEIDFLLDGHVKHKLDTIQTQLQQIVKTANQGVILQEGITIAIVGRPNAGKSSLLNLLAGKESAIVTEFAGTTRDIVQEQIQIDTIPLRIIDTAGLRDTNDPIEQIGVNRALEEINKADKILLVVDGSETKTTNPESLWAEMKTKSSITTFDKVTLVRNKIDQTLESAGLFKKDGHSIICISAKNGQGLDALKSHIKSTVEYDSQTEGNFSARRRHVEAIREALQHIDRGEQELELSAGELLAESLKLAQKALSRITGKFTPDDLLGEIFSSFCIGK